MDTMLTIQEVNTLELRDLDVTALDAEVEDVWAGVECMLKAEVVSANVLAAEISV